MALLALIQVRLDKGWAVGPGATLPTGATASAVVPGMALLALIQVRLDKVARCARRPPRRN